MLCLKTKHGNSYKFGKNSNKRAWDSNSSLQLKRLVANSDLKVNLNNPFTKIKKIVNSINKLYIHTI